MAAHESTHAAQRSFERSDAKLSVDDFKANIVAIG
jgi:hypothetical protein